MSAVITKARNGVKFVDEDRSRVGGYLVVWGDAHTRDLHGEYFTPQTDLGFDWFERRPVLYHHGLDGALKAALIGVIDKLQPDKIGVWAEAQLDLAQRYASAVKKLVERGVLAWSSGSLPHLVEVQAGGKIIRWPIIEGSLTPTPAEPRRTTVGMLKDANGSLYYEINADATRAAYKSAKLELPDGLKLDAAIESGDTEQGEGDDNNAQPESEGTPGNGAVPTESTKTRKTMTVPNATEVDIKQNVADAVAAALKERDDAAAQKALKDQADRAEDLEAKNTKLEEQLTAAKSAREEEDNAPLKRLPGGEGVQDPNQISGKTIPQIAVSSPFDSLDAIDMAFGVTILKSFRNSEKGPIQPSERYANALAQKAWQDGYRPLKRDGNAYKSDELSHSTQASYGDEWVPDLWSAEVWRKARQENVILPLFRAIEMPSNPYELPIETTDPTVYLAPETSDEAHLVLGGSGNPIPDSKIGSDKVQLSAKKLALRVGYSSELTEDSIIPVLAMYREQALAAMAASIDNVILNGDLTNAGTGNINLDDADPPDTSKYLAFDGLRHLPLVTTTANAIDASGAPTLALMREARFAMAAKYSVNPNNIAWIVDSSTYAKLLSLDEIVTMDKFGPLATVLTGQVGMMDGSPVLVSAEMGLTEADGKISTTGSNNVKGQGVCVYKPGWIVGYRRHITVYTEYLSYYDAYQMTATVRLALNRFDDDVAAALYDIAV